MIQKKFLITDNAGIHARPASLLTRAVQEFDGVAKIKFMEKEGNLKSIMSIMALGLKKGSEITVSLEGEMEESVFSMIEKIFIENKLVD